MRREVLLMTNSEKFSVELLLAWQVPLPCNDESVRLTKALFLQVRQWVGDGPRHSMHDGWQWLHPLVELRKKPVGQA